ncbi:hypothetical protein H9L39_01508 [Fusarium oxysporum f. sp. albedinis]|nr:hypothetical protein H9L39_01508 [Fusarium oxysporum f. sp. albedinis]
MRSLKRRVTYERQGGDGLPKSHGYGYILTRHSMPTPGKHEYKVNKYYKVEIREEFGAWLSDHIELEKLVLADLEEGRNLSDVFLLGKKDRKNENAHLIHNVFESESVGVVVLDDLKFGRARFGSQIIRKVPAILCILKRESSGVLRNQGGNIQLLMGTENFIFTRNVNGLVLLHLSIVGIAAKLDKCAASSCS